MKKTNNNETPSPKKENLNNYKKSRSLEGNKNKEENNKVQNQKEEESSNNNQEDFNNQKSKSRKNNISEIKKNQIKNNVFNILSKDFNRSGQEIRYAADYLSKNFTYFINLKNNDSQYKVEKLTKICKLEKYSPGEIIILYGDIGDKFYIVLEGSIEIYKPEYIEELMTPYDFLIILNKLREEDELKYERVKSKNDNFYFDTYDLNKIDKNALFMRSKFNFLIEVDDKKGEYGEGFSFGEIALIKKTRRNATIKSVENTTLLSISKDDYCFIMKEIETKKLSKEIEQFQKNFQFFKCFDIEKMIQLFNCFSKLILYKGDYLCHQNDLNDTIYIIINGTFEVYSYISFSWLNEYFNYIDDSIGNILFYMIKNLHLKYSELREIIENIKIDSHKSPMKNLDCNNLDKINSKLKTNKDNLYLIKNDEEKVNDKTNFFKINLKKVDYHDILGLENSFEFKRKFYSSRCVSSSAEVKCIKINELLRILWNSSNEDLLYLLKIIMNRKNILKKEIINGVHNLEKKILFGLDIRYENLINYEDNIYSPKNNICLKEKLETKYFKSKTNKKKENEINRVISAIKTKGYKMSIQDILDENINILPKTKTNFEKKLYRNRSAINLNILKNLLKNKTKNPHELKFKKKEIKFLLQDNDTLDVSRYMSPISSKRFTNYTSFKNNFNSFREFSGFSHDRNKNIYPEIQIRNSAFSNYFKRIKSRENSVFSNKNKNKINEEKNKINSNNIIYFNSEDKEFEIENYLNNENTIKIKKRNLLNINKEKNIKIKLDIKRNPGIFSPKNNIRMNKNISITNSNFNLINNQNSSAKIRINKGEKYLFCTTKKSIFNNFIINKYKNKRDKIQIISLSNEESLLKEKSKKRIMSHDNEFKMKKEKKNFYNACNILNLRKKAEILNDELKSKFQKRYNSQTRGQQASVKIKDDK